MLSDEQITKYQTLYKNRFGKEISREEAYEQGAKLIRLIELIYKPMTENEYKQLQKRREETKNLKI
jgi:urease accessory protein UreF